MTRVSVLLALAASIAVVCVGHSAAQEKIVFYESFDNHFATGERWVVSKASEYGGPWKHAKSEGTHDYGLLVTQKAKKYGIAAALPEPVDPKLDTVVLQYDLRLHSGIECGGAYLKFLMPQEAGWKPDDFNNLSPYSIMFGPDKCGATNKVHFIFRHKDPKSGEYREHHLKNPPIPLTDKLSHVYSAVIYPNNTLKILIDGEDKRTADLLSDDFDPPVLEPKTIPDPDETKPEDWDERVKIVDETATKPDDWDESAPRMIPDTSAKKPEGWLDDEPEEVDDPDAVKPEDWDDEEDGEWEPSKVPNPRCEEAPGCGEWKIPEINNPAYKGKWTAPMIDNPAYKGIWAPQEIPNPNYIGLARPDLEPVAAVGIEIWTMNDGFLFDNILVTHDEAAAAEYRATTWKPKAELEKEAEQAKRAKEAEEAKTAEPAKSPKDQIFDKLYKLAEAPLLKPYRLQVTQAIEFVEAHPEAQYGILGTLFALFVAFMYALIPGKKRRSKVPITMEAAKKEDVTGPDDVAAPVVDETSPAEEPEIVEAEGKTLKEKLAEAVSAEAVGTPLGDEIEAKDEDGPAGNTRRRSRRET